MEENTFDISEIADELSCEVASAVECAVGDALQNALPEALDECLSNLEFVLKDGTVVRPKKHIMVLSNDKTKYISCCGGLQVKGSSLWIQTRVSAWDAFHYLTKEEAKENLLKIKQAMDAGLESIAL